MSTEYKFKYDQKQPRVQTDWELEIEVEFEMINTEEIQVKSISAYKKDSDVNIFNELSVWDKGCIEGIAWEPPESLIREAYNDYCEYYSMRRG